MATAISRFFTQTFTVQRNQSLGGAHFGVAFSTIGSILGHMQQAQAEYIQNLGFNFRRGYIVWCPVSADIEVGDRLQIVGDGGGDGATFDTSVFDTGIFDSGGTPSSAYTVRALTEHNVGNNQHLELLLAREEETE